MILTLKQDSRVVLHSTPASSLWPQLCVGSNVQSMSRDSVPVHIRSSNTMGKPVPWPKKAMPLATEPEGGVMGEGRGGRGEW